MIFPNTDQEVAIQTIAERVCGELSRGKRVLWLTSGGSNVGAQVKIMNTVRERCADKLASLAIIPMDERYGKPGHADSNTQQLRDAGFDPGAATWIDVLARDLTFDETVSFYTDLMATAMANAGTIIGQFGLGGDAHTAGVLPDSPATTADETTIAGYEWTDYTRMTLTPAALQKVNVAYVLAYGDGKKHALERLHSNTEPLSEVPAKLLYQIPEVYVYNDQV